jgi:carboxymethylenebutenolidase
MIERTLALARPAGSMEAFVVHPAQGKPFPPVVVYMDMWGVREALRNAARRLAAAGYYAILPDLYYRRGRVRHAERELPGRRSFADLEPSRQVELRAAMDALSDAMVIDDTRALLAFTASGEPVREGTLGAVGYCMGGRHALCVAAAFPDRFKATACLHGAGLIRDGEDSPHLVARRALGEIYCGHAEKDQYAPADVAERLEAAFAGAPARFRQRVHAGLRHGYAVMDRDVYDERAAALDWEEFLGMLQRQLCPR